MNESHPNGMGLLYTQHLVFRAIQLRGHQNPKIHMEGVTS
jgi:hypothetical protein